MKNLRRLCAGLILTLALTSTAFAGQMDCPGVTSTPPPPEAEVTGDMPTGGVSADPMTVAMLSLIETMVTLF